MALLSDTELCDVWRVARLVQAALETLHPNASGFNIAVQVRLNTKKRAAMVYQRVHERFGC
jgi:diadenosine tetraphosphate (Ap4A) HIT family hydrolase